MDELIDLGIDRVEFGGGLAAQVAAELRSSAVKHDTMKFLAREMRLPRDAGHAPEALQERKRWVELAKFR